MSHRHTGRAAQPEDLSLLKVLAELGCVVVLLLCVKAIEWIYAPHSLPHRHAPKPRPAATRPRIRPPPLHWRSRWWAWQLLAWAVAILTAPTVLLVGSALLVSPHSDHPLFWWSLPAIVAIGNAVAILCINQQHHRDPFTDRQTMARRHVLIGGTFGATLLLIVGLTSGFLADVVAPLATAANMPWPALASTLFSVVLAVIFAALSFAHAGAVYAAFAFELADVRRHSSIEA